MFFFVIGAIQIRDDDDDDDETGLCRVRWPIVGIQLPGACMEP